MKRLRISVYGRVQGVGLRYHTWLQARYAGLIGFVRNEKDGSVTIEAQGDERALEVFVQGCVAGPDAASVEKFDIVNISIGVETDFTIL